MVQFPAGDTPGTPDPGCPDSLDTVPLGASEPPDIPWVMVLDKRAGKGPAVRGGFCPQRPQVRGLHGLCPDIFLLHPAAPTTETAPGEEYQVEHRSTCLLGGLLAHHGWGPEEAPAGVGALACFFPCTRTRVLP